MINTFEFTTPATIKYDPPRKNMKRNTQWWCVAYIDREITRYYRWWVWKRFHINLCKPSWDGHISIVRGEEPNNQLKHLWKQFDGQTVNVHYSHFIRQGGDTGGFNSKPEFFFIEATHPLFTQIRDQFQLKSNWHQHITIGRVWHDQHIVCTPDTM